MPDRRPDAQYGYVEITEPLVGWRLTRWLYALCWTGTDRPSVLFERATTWLMTHKALLPGSSILERHVARLPAGWSCGCGAASRATSA